MSVFGFCKNKCKHEVYTKEETENRLTKGQVLMEDTTEYVGKYLKLFELEFIAAWKDHYIFFDLVDTQSGGFCKRFYLDARKEEGANDILVKEFREIFSQEKNTDQLSIFAVVEGNEKLSVWYSVQVAHCTPVLKIQADLYNINNHELITITPNVVVDTLPTGTAVQQTKDKVVIAGTQTLSHETGTYKENNWQVAYPLGYNKTNTIVLAYVTGIKGCFDTSTNVSVGAYGEKDDITGFMGGTMAKRIILTNDYIDVRCTNMLTDQDAIIDYKIVLMKA